MARSRITINGVTSSYVEVPINSTVTLTNDGDGGETSVKWYSLTGSQPSGSHDTFSSPTGNSTTFVPTREGSYLIKNLVNSALTSSAIVAVKHLTSNLRAPAAGEKLEESGSFGWAYATQKLFDKVNELYADSGLVVGSAEEPLCVGTLVRPSGTLNLKDGLPGQQTVLRFYGIAGEATGSFQTTVYLVDSPITGSHTLISSGTLFRARLYGLAGPYTGSMTVGDVLFPRADGALSKTLANVDRKIGSVIAVDGTNYWIHFDGTSGWRPGEGGAATATNSQVTLDDTTSFITTNVTSSKNFDIQLVTGGKTVLNPSGTVPGDTIKYLFRQDGTGSRTVFFDSAFKFPENGSNPSVFWKPYASTMVTCYVRSASNGVAQDMFCTIDVSSSVYNVKDFGALGNSNNNDTAAINRAITAAGNNSVIYFPPGNYVVTGTLLITGSAVHVRGDSPAATRITFQPDAVTGPHRLFKFDRYPITGSQNYLCGLSDIQLISDVSTSVLKYAVEVVDISQFDLSNIAITNWVGLSQSVGLYLRGKEALMATNVYIQADKPIIMHSGTITADDAEADHFHFTNLHLIGSDNVLEPLITINDGVHAPNLTFDGFQVWAKGGHGLYYVGSSNTSNVGNITINNVRSEQGSSGSSYSVYIDGGASGLVRQLNLVNCRFDSARNGVYLRNVTKVKLDNCLVTASPKEAINANSSVGELLMAGAWCPPGTTATLTDLTRKWGFQKSDATSPVETHGLYVNNINTYVANAHDLFLHNELRFEKFLLNPSFGYSTTRKVLNAVDDTSAVRTITISSADIARSGSIFFIKDEMGLAGTNPISIVPGVGKIDGTSGTFINTNYGYLACYTNGTDIFTIGRKERLDVQNATVLGASASTVFNFTAGAGMQVAVAQTGVTASITLTNTLVTASLGVANAGVTATSGTTFFNISGSGGIVTSVTQTGVTASIIVSGTQRVGSSGQKYIDSIFLAGITSYSGTSPYIVGQFQFDASEYTLANATTTYELRVVGAMSTTNTATGSVQLYNLTDSDPITVVNMTGTTNPKLWSATLTAGAGAGQVDNSSKIYEVRVSSSVSTETLELGSVQLKVINTIN